MGRENHALALARIIFTNAPNSCVQRGKHVKVSNDDRRRTLSFTIVKQMVTRSSRRERGAGAVVSAVDDGASANEHVCS